MLILLDGGSGRGRITRAASIARRIGASVHHKSSYVEPLEWAGIPHTQIPRETDLKDYRESIRGGKVLVDGIDYHRLGEPPSGWDMEAYPLILPFPEEILEHQEARKVLGLSGPCILLATSLVDGPDYRVIKREAVRAGFRVVMSQDIPYPPSLYMRGFSGVIGGAGYNLWWETKIIGVPALLFPNPMTSDQLLRTEPKDINDLRSFLNTC